jgi:hypothetical protein
MHIPMLERLQIGRNKFTSIGKRDFAPLIGLKVSLLCSKLDQREKIVVRKETVSVSCIKTSDL